MALSTTNPTVFSSTFALSTLQNQESSQGEENAEWVSVTIKVVLILMIIVTVLGNIWVLAATWLDIRLHQPNKYFIACLALADLLVGVFSIPIRVYMYFNRAEVLPVQLCGFWSWIDVLAEAASISTLTVISIDRYFKISKPFKYKTQMTGWRSMIVIFFIWLISSTFATLGQFSYGGSKGVMSSPANGCINDNVVYYTIASTVFFFVPTLIIITMYVLIFCIAHKRHKMTRNGALGQTFVSGKKKRKEFLQEWKTIRMLALVVGTFIVCWGPFFILFILLSYELDYLVTSLGIKNLIVLENIFIVILPSFNSLCNPIIYACYDREYSKAFKHVFQRMFHSRRSSRKSVTLSKSLGTQSFRVKENKRPSFPASQIEDNVSHQAETCLL